MLATYASLLGIQTNGIKIFYVYYLYSIFALCLLLSVSKFVTDLMSTTNRRRYINNNAITRTINYNKHIIIVHHNKFVYEHLNKSA